MREEAFQAAEDPRLKKNEKPRVVITKDNRPPLDTRWKKECRYVDHIRQLSLEFPKGYNCLKIGLPKLIKKNQAIKKMKLETSRRDMSLNLNMTNDSLDIGSCQNLKAQDDRFFYGLKSNALDDKLYLTNSSFAFGNHSI